MATLMLASFAEGSFIFIGVLVVFLFAVIFGYYTMRGSGINAHPTSGGRDGSPGARGPSHSSGMGRVSGNPNYSSPDGIGMRAGDAFSSRGTDSSRRRRRARRRRAAKG